MEAEALKTLAKKLALAIMQAGEGTKFTETLEALGFTIGGMIGTAKDNMELGNIFLGTFSSALSSASGFTGNPIDVSKGSRDCNCTACTMHHASQPAGDVN